MTDVNQPPADEPGRPTPPQAPQPAAVPDASPAYSPPPAPAQAPTYAQQPAYGQPYAAQPKWNVLSIVSFILSVVGISLVGVVLGHIGLSQVRKTGEQGRGFAIAGLILGYLGILAGIILFFVVLIPLIFFAASNGDQY
jgi:hypothetical protein